MSSVLSLPDVSAIALHLKRTALERKNEGNVEAAQALLRQVKWVENDLNLDQAEDLKRLALLLKQTGDLAGAKQALYCAKVILVQQQEQEQQRQQQATEGAAVVGEYADSQPSSMGEQQEQESPPEGETPDTQTASSIQEEECEDPLDQAMDATDLEELMDPSSSSTGGGEIQFTDEEMLDVETMADMKSMGLAIASSAVYKARMEACQRAAIQAKKQGDLASAMSHLQKSKQFTKAMEILFRDGDGNEGEIEELSDGEDYSLLEELNTTNQDNDDGSLEQLFGKASTTIELEDLDDLDPSMLREMMDSGLIEIPKVEEVLQKATEKRNAAIEFKKSGNLMAAKAALEESKRLERCANQLRDMLKAAASMSDKHNDNPDAMLEALMEQENSSVAVVPEKPKAPTLLSSQEYREQVVKFKEEGKTKEALDALRLYKQVLAVEASAQVAQQRKEYVIDVQNEIQLAKDQIRLFDFFSRFVDSELGTTQLASWESYRKQCAAAIGKMEENGTTSPPMLQRNPVNELKLKEIREPDLGFIGRAIQSTDDARIEVCIMQCVDLAANRNLRKVIGTEIKKPTGMPQCDSIRFVVNSQLPSSVKDPEESVQLLFAPHSRNEDENGITYAFQGSQYLNAERGNSRFAKLLQRRLMRKRFVIDVKYLVVKKSLFSKTVEEHHLGTAIVELKDLLQQNWIANDFPLLDTSRRNQVGGSIRLAIRTSSPFTETISKEAKDGEETMVGSVDLTTSAVNIQSFDPFTL